MRRIARFFTRMPIGIRLTLWFVILLGIVITAWGQFLYDALVDVVSDQVDQSLEVVSNQIRANIIAEGDRLVFADNADVRQIGRSYAIFILAPDGDVWDRLGAADWVETASQLAPGYTEVFEVDDDDGWRTLLVEVSDTETGVTGWLQISQSSHNTHETLEDLGG